MFRPTEPRTNAVREKRLMATSRRRRSAAIGVSFLHTETKALWRSSRFAPSHGVGLEHSLPAERLQSGNLQTLTDSEPPTALFASESSTYGETFLERPFLARSTRPSSHGCRLFGATSDSRNRTWPCGKPLHRGTHPHRHLQLFHS